MKTLANTFFKGLLFTLPIAITFGLLYWLFALAESLFKIPLQWLLPAGWYVHGLGVLCAALLIFCVGLLVQAYVVKYAFSFVEGLLARIPLVKTLYSSAKDFIHFFAGGQDAKMHRVVRVAISEDISLIGFVTNDGITLGETSGLVAVYFPMSYQVGGYLAYLPWERCEPLDMPVQKAMQQVLTAHIKK